MTKTEILKKLNELQSEFSPDQCIDWAYDAIDVIDDIIGKEFSDAWLPDVDDSLANVYNYDTNLLESIVGKSKEPKWAHEVDEARTINAINEIADPAPFDKFIESLMQAAEDSGLMDEIEKFIEEQEEDAPAQFGRLDDDELEGQYRWNGLFTDLHSDSIEGEDVYSMCVGYLLGHGYSPDSAHRIASHGGTKL